MKINLLVCTPEPLLAIGAMTSLSGYCAVATCENSTQAIALLEGGDEKYDVTLIDLSHEPDLLAVQRATNSSKSKVVLWVNDVVITASFQAIRAGVVGVVRKTVSVTKLIECIQNVSEGNYWVENTIVQGILAAKPISLTRRGGQFVTYLAQGLKNREIATILGISEQTVKVSLSRLFYRLKVKDRSELALIGLRNGADKAGSEGIRSLVIEHERASSISLNAEQ